MIKLIKSFLPLVAILSLLILAFSSCEKGIYGKGDTLYYTPEVADFDAVAIRLAADVSITYAPDNALSLWAQENIMENMEIFVSNRTLFLKFEERVNRHRPITINLQMTELERIDLSGACYVEVLSPFVSKRMDIHSSGVNHIHFTDSLFCGNMSYNASGTAYLDAEYLTVDDEFAINTSGVSRSRIEALYCNKMNYKVSGSASPSFHGQCNSQHIESSGTLRYSGLDFVSNYCDVSISGTADLDLFVEEELSLDVSGKAKIRYKGQANITNHSNKNITLIGLE